MARGRKARCSTSAQGGVVFALLVAVVEGGVASSRDCKQLCDRLTKGTSE